MAKFIGTMCFALLGGISLAGCMATPVEIAQLESVHTVFVKPISEPHIEVRSAMDHDWTPSGSDISLNEIVAKGDLHLGAETYSTLSNALRQDGYQLATSGSAADAVLEVNIEDAYYFINPIIAGGGCVPFGLFDVRLTNTKTGKVILDRTYRLQSGGGTGVTGHVLLDAGVTYNVDDCAALWSNPKIPVSAFRFAEAELAAAIGTELESHQK